MRALSLLFFVLAGCGTEPGDATCASDYPPPAELDAAYTSCEVDDDCIVLEVGLCDQCNGGTAVAINAASEAEVFDAYAECEPEDEWACTEMACPPLVPRCDAGVCVADEGTF